MNLGALDHVLSFSAVPIKQPKAEDKFRILMRERTSAQSGLVGPARGSSYYERQYLLAAWLLSLVVWSVCISLPSPRHRYRAAARQRMRCAW